MKDKITYQQLIESLRNHTYEAPDAWHKIEDQLSLDRALTKLKTHRVESDLWTNISDALETDQQLSRQKKLTKTYWIVSGIVIMIVSIVIGVWWSATSNTASAYTYSSEIEYEQISYGFDEKMNVLEQKGNRFIDENDFLFESDIILEYKKEIEKIDKAIERVKIASEQYGTDVSMAKVLAKLEREKASLIKKMINRT